MIEVITLSLGLLAWVAGTASLAVALYVKYSLTAKLKAELYEVKDELLGAEQRIEASLEKKVNVVSSQMREIAQNDAVDLIEAVVGSQSDPQVGGLGLASFRNVKG